MKFTLKSNIKSFLENFETKGEKVVNAMNKAFKAGMRYYEGHIIKEQMSGRKGNRYGLNVGRGKKSIAAGNLRKSWRVKEKTIAGEIVLVLGTSTVYARIHQFSGWTGRGYKTFIPKRLYIIEEFETIGRDKIIRELSRAASKFVK